MKNSLSRDSFKGLENKALYIPYGYYYQFLERKKQKTKKTLNG